MRSGRSTSACHRDGGHNSHRAALMPRAAAATIHTDKLVNGDTGVQIQCCVRQEDAVAFPAPPRCSLFSVLFHYSNATPTGGHRPPVRSRAGNPQREQSPVRGNVNFPSPPEHTHRILNSSPPSNCLDLLTFYGDCNGTVQVK